jgi:hypothetical protein
MRDSLTDHLLSYLRTRDGNKRLLRSYFDAVPGKSMMAAFSAKAGENSSALSRPERDRFPLERGHPVRMSAKREQPLR